MVVSTMKKYVKLRNFVILLILVMAISFYLYVIVILPQIKSGCTKNSYCAMADCKECEIINNQKTCNCTAVKDDGTIWEGKCKFQE